MKSISARTAILPFVSLTLILSFAGLASAATYYVNQAGGEDFTNIQSALNSVAGGGLHTIIVRDGTYTGANNKDLDFGGKAITLRSDNGAPNCIIDCENSGRGFYFHSGETSAAIVDGFAITGGNTSPGGAIFCTNASSPTIANCIITGNSGGQDGGGICCYGGSSPTVTNCIISGNSANYGGGIEATGAGASPSIVNCTITENIAAVNGGAIECFSSAAPQFSNSILWGNSAPNGTQIYVTTGVVTWARALLVPLCGVRATSIRIPCLLMRRRTITTSNPIHPV